MCIRDRCLARVVDQSDTLQIVLDAFRLGRRTRPQNEHSQKMCIRDRSFGIVIAGYIYLQVMVATGNISSLLESLLVPICAYVIMAVSLNLTVGILGELSLGHAGFMSVRCV